MNQHPQTAIVTGSSTGIGLALTNRLLREGWNVVANSRNILQAGTLAESAQLKLIPGDVAEKSLGKRLVETAMEFGAGLDLLVNNAGIFVPSAFEDYSEEQYERVMGTNLRGLFFLTQEAVRVMKSQKRGHIVSISTTLVEQPVKGVNAALTSMSKGGMNALTRQLSLELVSEGIRVNTIASGIIDTPMHQPEAHEFLKTLHPMNRLGTVDDIVEAVMYLQGAQFVTGEILYVDGGANAGKW